MGTRAVHWRSPRVDAIVTDRLGIGVGASTVISGGPVPFADPQAGSWAPHMPAGKARACQAFWKKYDRHGKPLRPA